MRKSRNGIPLPEEFLRWQVDLRRHTMIERNGSPHPGVAPLLSVQWSGRKPAVTTHSIICGLLPAPELLAEKTAEFKQLYEETAPDEKATYARGIDYLKRYYREPSHFDPTSISSMLAGASPAIRALEAEPSCSLVFYVFDLADQTDIGRFRCLQLDCSAEIHRSGAVFDNVWWHNRLFHGDRADSVVLQFHHQGTFDTGFGSLTRVE